MSLSAVDQERLRKEMALRMRYAEDLQRSTSQGIQDESRTSVTLARRLAEQRELDDDFSLSDLFCCCCSCCGFSSSAEDDIDHQRLNDKS